VVDYVTLLKYPIYIINTYLMIIDVGQCMIQ